MSFTKNSPLWAKRARIALAGFFAGVIVYGDILAPALGMNRLHFDQWAGFLGFVSTVIFSLFGVQDETTNDTDSGR